MSVVNILWCSYLTVPAFVVNFSKHNYISSRQMENQGASEYLETSMKIREPAVEQGITSLLCLISLTRVL